MNNHEQSYLDKGKSEERDTILFGAPHDWKKDSCGGVVRFKDVTLAEMKLLVEKGLLDLEGRQNDAMSTGEYMEFMEKFPDSDLTVHGYAVSPYREDVRVSIEGLQCDSGVTEELRLAFIELERHADEFEARADYLFSWWD